MFYICRLCPKYTGPNDYHNPIAWLYTPVQDHFLIKPKGSTKLILFHQKKEKIFIVAIHLLLFDTLKPLIEMSQNKLNK